MPAHTGRHTRPLVVILQTILDTTCREKIVPLLELTDTQPNTLRGSHGMSATMALLFRGKTSTVTAFDPNWTRFIPTYTGLIVMRSSGYSMRLLQVLLFPHSSVTKSDSTVNIGPNATSSVLTINWLVENSQSCHDGDSSSVPSRLSPTEPETLSPAPIAPSRHARLHGLGPAQIDLHWGGPQNCTHPLFLG